MSHNLSCPKCNHDEVFVARDTYSTRSCGKCFFTWLPQLEVDKNRIPLDQIFIGRSFIYKDNHYVVQRHVKIKSVLGHWLDGIEYVPLKEESPTIFYVRTYEEFVSKFKSI